MPALIRCDFGFRGFSSREETFSSFISTTPNALGSGTSAKAMTGPRTFPWNARSSERACPDTTTSPFTLRKGPSTCRRMHPMAWAVPRRSPCSSYAIERSRSAPSPKRSRIRWPCHPMRIANSLIPAASNASERGVDPRLDSRAFPRLVCNRAADHRVTRDFSDQFIERASCDQGDESRSRVDSVRTERRLRENPSTGRFSPEVCSASLDFRRDVDVSDPSPPDRSLREKVLEHHRSVHRDDESGPNLLTREEGQQQIASHEGSFAVNGDHPISVSVMGDPEIRPTGANRRPEAGEVLLGRLGFTAREVTVRLRVDRDHVASHLPEQEGRDRARGPAGAIHDDPDLRRSHALHDRVHIRRDQVRMRRLRAHPIPGRRGQGNAAEAFLDLPLLLLVHGHPIPIP